MQVGDLFTLLPQRHPPVEPPYPASFLQLAGEDEEDDPAHCLVCSCDGSSKREVGGMAVVVVPPYVGLEEAVIAYGKIPGRCTNIRAEVWAATQALRMIKKLIQFTSLRRFQIQTDSLYVVHLLHDVVTSVANVSDVVELQSLWNEVRAWATVRHVRGHRGDPYNHVADHFAKLAVQHTHTCVVHRTYDAVRASFGRPEDIPAFYEWW